ncbi:Adenylate kinase 4 [Vitis vinifera]|uniref:Adenylate kinase 4 n=1 Tax=Vitis vinifera TaxID=29760 RepID=A0A438I268_VITVI|nr:Adenylate kinase 4 [Vitis vinifera]
MGSSSGVVLEEIPSVDLMTELLRRMKCSSKPDKRLILVGIHSFLTSVLVDFDV